MLILGLVPYAALVLVDAWMHEKCRRVPRIEQCLHGLIFVFVATFVAAVLLDRNLVAAAALIFALPCLAADELGFHGTLAVRERRVHYLADLALLVFIALWLTTVFT